MRDVTSIISDFDKSSIILILDKKGIITYVNDKYLEISNYEKNEIIGRPYNTISSVFYSNSYYDQFWERVRRGQVWQGEIKCQSKDGTDYWVDMHIIPYKNEQGVIFEYMAIGTEVTRSKAMDESLTKTIRDLQDIKNALDESSIVAITDGKGVISYVNDKFCEISKYDREELVGKTHRVINSGYHPKSFFKVMWDTIKHGEVWKGEVKNRAKDGNIYWMNTTIVPYLDDEGVPYQYVSIRTDITDRIRAETALAEALQNDFMRTVKNLRNCIFKVVVDDNNRITYTLCEGKLAEELGLTMEKVLNKTSHEIFNDEVAKLMESNLHHALTGVIVNFEIEYLDKYFYITLSPIQQNEKIVEVVGSMIDITERKKAEETIYYMAHYDALTQLPNRTLFNNQLIKALALAKEKNEKVGVIFIDLDRFKTINDTLGHSTGDNLLKAVAVRLAECLRSSDCLSRQGGDEFTLFLPNITRKEIEGVAQKIIDRMSEVFTLEHMEIYITPSIGISIFPDDGDNIEVLLKNADGAMYLAKERSKNNYQFFTNELHQAIAKKLKIEGDLRRALDQNQFVLYYQPKVDMVSSKIVGMEALIRWNHPELGLVPPMEFIPIAEETGLIIPIGEWVMRTACRQLKEWHEAGYNQMSIAVNISLRQFIQNDLHEVIKRILEETDLLSEFLELEITESIAHDAKQTIRILNRIKSLGVKISIDDFGIGYSSLSYLSQFPIDRLKIDQSFVRHLNPRNQAIIKTIIDMAHNMDIAVIAEGVETEEHVEFLKQQKCKEVQGYYYSKPLSEIDAYKFISDYESEYK
ncbi:sensor domain-containing protein [Paenibacillus crassostreae]|uniref:PAS domain S-box protein n=1 Tax=Paenibacillus crassostreae TaxID=1763538 RepID=A0A167GC63_9BACL|nr:EAL domain-containing protein [Paenibacillus crassostreae]AOZ92664.1 PAS domain S-box protein [Paenibacillus crassostreae]OAB77433.1 PAS domain S-box protein [Paenibacillus crassostreae]